MQNSTYGPVNLFLTLTLKSEDDDDDDDKYNHLSYNKTSVTCEMKLC